jgi:hypothetical protein
LEAALLALALTAYLVVRPSLSIRRLISKKPQQKSDETLTGN